VFVTSGSGVLTGGCPDGTRVQVALDPDGHAAGRYNAAWRPRTYLVDEGGRLLYVQPDTTLDPQTPLEVQALLARR